jgi:murein DD-endopeptidase MepM/ murein hydrolase activator NlpD
MGKLRDFFGKGFTTVTIMVIPHSKQKPIRVRVSAIGLFSCLLLSVIGATYVLSVGVKTAEYYGMRRKLTAFSSQATEMKVAMSSLRKAESDVVKLLSLKSKKKILEESDTASDLGSINIELLKRQVDETIQSVAEIREYIKEERSTYRATPTGWPVHGEVTSPFGTRVHPISGVSAFHSGIDIRTPPGTPVKATADGMVSYSSWGEGTGNVVVLEHGRGLTTVYAHNTRNSVKVGQRVKKGQAIAISGSTGSSTGPHVHYEVWKNKVHVNPAPFLKDVT